MPNLENYISLCKNLKVSHSSIKLSIHNVLTIPIQSERLHWQISRKLLKASEKYCFTHLYKILALIPFLFSGLYQSVLTRKADLMQSMQIYKNLQGWITMAIYRVRCGRVQKNCLHATERL